MKIAVVIENKIDAGGGFGQAMNAILQLNKLSDNKFTIEIHTSVLENIEYFNAFELQAKFFKPSLLDKFITLFAKTDLWELLTRYKKIIGTFEKKLIKSDVDLVYFPTPSMRPLALQSLNYIYTVWDLSHRDTPEFPEVRSYNQSFIRDAQFTKILPGAILTICDSPVLVGQIMSRYGIDSEKLLAMPYSYSPFLKKLHESDVVKTLEKYKLSRGYFFYPAQFWPHKNHYRLLLALKKMNDAGIKRNLIFVGGDKGNYSYIESVISALNLNEQVFNLGFVPFEDLGAIYQGCSAVVMPTYFGPTNLPPYEAWFFGKPLIYSNSCADQAGDAALLINPDSEDSILEALRLIENPVITEQLIENGYKRLQHFGVERKSAELKLTNILNSYSVRRACWGIDEL